MSIETHREDLLDYAAAQFPKVETLEGVMARADVYAKAVVYEALEKARNSVPTTWRSVLDYIERIDTEAIAALGAPSAMNLRDEVARLVAEASVWEQHHSMVPVPGDAARDRLSRIGPLAEKIVVALEAAPCDCRCSKCEHRVHMKEDCNTRLRGVEYLGPRVFVCACAASEEVRHYDNPNGLRCALLREIAEALGLAEEEG